jgi:hypothetical protein
MEKAFFTQNIKRNIRNWIKFSRITGFLSQPKMKKFWVNEVLNISLNFGIWCIMTLSREPGVSSYSED